MSQKKAYLAMLVSIPVLWVIAIKVTGFPAFIMPTPSMVAKVLWVERWSLMNHTIITLIEALAGYLVATLLAAGLAISFLYIPWVEDFATPWTVVIKNVPFVTIASILIITLGESPAPKIIIVVLVTFFPLLANLSKGLKGVDQVLIDRMRSLNATEWQIFRHVRWPTAIPYYIAANEIAFTGSIIGAIVAEWLFARQGLGFLIVRSLTQYRADRLYAVTLIASVLAVGAYALVRLAEDRLLSWKKDQD